MSLTVQNIIDDISADVRTQLATSGDAATLMIRWVDQTHKDVLHTSNFRHYIFTTENVALASGTANYTMSATNIRAVDLVFNSTFGYELKPFETAQSPQMTDYFARFFRLNTSVSAGTNTHTLYVFPPPHSASTAGTVTVHYQKEVTTLSSVSDTLVVPEDGRDVMVAGVLYRAFSYLKRPQEAAQWAAAYTALKGAKSANGSS